MVDTHDRPAAAGPSRMLDLICLAQVVFAQPDGQHAREAEATLPRRVRSSRNLVGMQAVRDPVTPASSASPGRDLEQLPVGRQFAPVASRAITGPRFGVRGPGG
jgi:hypothetical protein